MKFSVVIPVYNVAPYLCECLESVVKAVEQFQGFKISGSQGFKVEELGVEVICVDDGSTDGSGAILDEYASRFNSSTFQPFNFKVIHQPNRGVNAARNVALDVATGDWICFLDGDDLYSPDMLAAGAKLIRDNPECDIVRIAAATFRDGAAPRTATPYRMGLLTGVFCAGFYRRAKFGGVRFADFLVGEDRVYAATCVFRTGRIAESETVGYLYRQRATSISHTGMTPRKAQDSFLHVAEMLKIAAANGRTMETALRRLFVSELLEACASHIWQLAQPDRREVDRLWRTCIEEMRTRGFLTPWGDFVAHVIAVLPFRPVVWTLCVLPRWLKRRGVHR